MYDAFHILRNRDTEAKLRKELEEAWSDATALMSLEKLEGLPYLVRLCFIFNNGGGISMGFKTAVIKEGLRLSHGVVTPLPRVVHENTSIAGVQVPAGVRPQLVALCPRPNH